MVRDIARADGLRFRLASIRADLPRQLVKEALRSGRVTPIDSMAPLSEAEIDEASHLVGQMGTEAFCRALQAEADVVIAGRACDTAIFAAVPALLGCAMGPAMHMAKIIECASLCCVPGGRDPILATLEGDSFVLESMNPKRRATAMSVAAHSLYEQSDPDRVAEPEGVLLVRSARYEEIDDRRARVSGAQWIPASHPTVKLEGSVRVGERAVLLCGSCDQRVIARIRDILAEVSEVVRGLVCRDEPEDYRLIFRVYGIDGVYPWPAPPSPMPREIFTLGECVAPSADRAGAVVRTTKQSSCITGFPAGSRPRATSPSRSPRRNCPAARRTASTSITSCKSTSWRRCSRSRSRICDRSRAARSPERQVLNARTGQSRKMLSHTGT